MDEDKNAATEDDSLPVLDVAAQVEVPFLDELLLAAQGVDGDLYLSEGLRIPSPHPSGWGEG